MSKLDNKLIEFFYRLELNRKTINKKNKNQNIVPNYVLKRRIKFITNGEVIFDSNDFKECGIPISIQYSIKQYGYPETIKPNNKTPLIYNITSKASSILPVGEEKNCI